MKRFHGLVLPVCLAATLGSGTLACDDDDDELEDVIDDDDLDDVISEAVDLDSDDEVPPPIDADDAEGKFTYELSRATGTMSYILTVSDLTGPATAAHIHRAPKGEAGPIVIPLDTPANGTAQGTVVLTREQMADLENDLLYVNVHTALNPAGEVRGQLDD